MSDGPPRTFLFAGGGSGGHISPALAVAERLRDAPQATRVIHVCSDRAIDRHMLGAARACFTPIPARPPSARPAAALAFIRAHRRSVARCLEIIDRENVDHVVAFGGFVAVPAIAAATRRRRERTLINLDCPPGRANRWLAGRVTTTWSAVPLPDTPDFASRVVGLPLRRRVIATDDRITCRRRLGLDENDRVLLVTGASQGARSLNELMTRLVGEGHFLPAGWQILHLAGAERASDLERVYARAGVAAAVIPFLDEMGLAWGAADLAVSRAGANSVAEVVANAVPTLFLPYPFHRDRHQHHNAQPLVDSGGAVVADDLVDPVRNTEHLRPILAELLADENARVEMRSRLATMQSSDAAAHIASLLLGNCDRSGKRHEVQWACAGDATPT